MGAPEEHHNTPLTLWFKAFFVMFWIIMAISVIAITNPHFLEVIPGGGGH